MARRRSSVWVKICPLLPLINGEPGARQGGYATNATKGKSDIDFHNEVRMPIIAFYADDDDIANAVTVEDLMRTFPHASKQVFKIDPAQVGLKSLGHINWFRSSHQTVWPLLAQAIKGDKQ